MIFSTRNRLDFSLGGPGFEFYDSMCFRGCFRGDIDTYPNEEVLYWDVHGSDRFTIVSKLGKLSPI